MKLILTSILLLSSCILLSQSGFYGSFGYGFNYGKGDLSGIQDSYTSYKVYSSQTYSADPFEDNGNWKTNQASPTLSFTIGYQMDDLLFDMSFHRSAYSQDKELIRESGYGRSFLWKEKRNEILVNVGYRFEKLAIFAGLGSNFNKFSMASYQVYPDGTKSINNEFIFNGLFKGEDVGTSYSAAIKYYIFDYLHAELRYIYSSDKLVGEKENFLSLSDFTNARAPLTGEFPADYNQPLDFNNSVLSSASRSYLIFTLCLEFNSLNY